MVSFYFPDEIKVSTVDITFVGEQSVFQKSVFSWKVKVISFGIKFWFRFEENIMCYLTNLRFHHIWFSITFSLHTLAWLTVIRCESDLSENEKINRKRTQNHVLPLKFQIHFLGTQSNEHWTGVQLSQLEGRNPRIQSSSSFSWPPVLLRNVSLLCHFTIVLLWFSICCVV